MVPCLCSRRWILAYVSFFGYFFMYSVRRGEFDWDKTTQSLILAFYFYGYAVMQLPVGWLAGRYGGKMLWGVPFFFCGLCTIFTPVAGRTSVYLVYTIRFLVGLASGSLYPSNFTFIGKWAPPLERTKLLSFSMAGTDIGTIATFALSGYLCEHGFGKGWDSIFYLTGGGTLIWLVFWLWLTDDSPRDSTRISMAELEHIETTVGYKTNEPTISTPWGAMLKSKVVWAAITACVSYDWIMFTLSTELPTFLKEALHFDAGESGSLSALPFLCACLVGTVSGQVADCLRSRTSLSTATVRKILNAACFTLTSSFLVGASFVTSRQTALLCMCLAVGGSGFHRSGALANYVDIAPRYAGLLIGIGNLFSSVSGMVAPIITGVLTRNKSPEEWRNVFFVCAGLAVTCILVFTTFADGVEQEWAKQGRDQPELTVQKWHEEENPPPESDETITDKA